ncbi:hypothetical protein GEV33_008632 [Tenebrio molitor]|uniref:Reverse transcriptase domain-containing protein n=1 Tax=Tenebrio molitor TaxID=7067 RepID=A0A8J6HGD3_TENMO|nr:hypothetical protein GEV33_008632 [Tenebrio molitor]
MTKVMIPKLGKDSTNSFPYRPISFLNIAGNIFEKILSNRLKNFLETNNLLPPEQFAFRSERSTINPNFESHTDTTRYANLKECPLAVFLDIERAFNKVWHNGVILECLINVHTASGVSVSAEENPTRQGQNTGGNQFESGKFSRPFAGCKFRVKGAVKGSPGRIAEADLRPPPRKVLLTDRSSGFNPHWRLLGRVVPGALLKDHGVHNNRTITWSSGDTHLHAQDPLDDITIWANAWKVKPNSHKSQSILVTYPGSFTSRIRGRICGCDPKTLYHTYKSFIRPVIEYRAPIYATCLYSVCEAYADKP